MMDGLPAAPSPPTLHAAPNAATLPVRAAATATPSTNVPRGPQLAAALARLATRPLPATSRVDARHAQVMLQVARLDIPQQVATHATVMRMALQLLPAGGRPRPRAKTKQASTPTAARSADELLGRAGVAPPAPTHRTLLAAFARNGIAPVGTRSQSPPVEPAPGA